MTMPALSPNLAVRQKRLAPGRENRIEKGVPESWTDRPPMPIPSAFTPSKRVGRSWTGGRPGAGASTSALALFVGAAFANPPRTLEDRLDWIHHEADARQ